MCVTSQNMNLTNQNGVSVISILSFLVRKNTFIHASYPEAHTMNLHRLHIDKPHNYQNKIHMQWENNANDRAHWWLNFNHCVLCHQFVLRKFFALSVKKFCFFLCLIFCNFENSTKIVHNSTCHGPIWTADGFKSIICEPLDLLSASVCSQKLFALSGGSNPSFSTIWPTQWISLFSESFTIWKAALQRHRKQCKHCVSAFCEWANAKDRSTNNVEVIWQGNPISCVKTFKNLNCSLCTRERLEIYNAMKEDKKNGSNLLINSLNELYGGCRHNPKFHRYCHICPDSADEAIAAEKLKNG